MSDCPRPDVNQLLFTKMLVLIYPPTFIEINITLSHRCLVYFMRYNEIVVLQISLFKNFIDNQSREIKAPQISRGQTYS